MSFCFVACIDSLKLEFSDVSSSCSIEGISCKGLSPGEASCFVETVVSQPSGKRMCAYCGFASIRSTSSTNRSYLLWRTFLFMCVWICVCFVCACVLCVLHEFVSALLKYLSWHSFLCTSPNHSICFHTKKNLPFLVGI